MKRLLGLFLVLCSAPAWSGNFGAGVIFGEPTGLSAKYYYLAAQALDMGLTWSFSGEGSVHVHGDWLWHWQNRIRVEQEFITPYVGLGLRLKAGEENNARVGVRFPMGLSYRIPPIPLEIFLELVPLMDLAPDITGAFNGGVGFRYYF